MGNVYRMETDPAIEPIADDPDRMLGHWMKAQLYYVDKDWDSLLLTTRIALMRFPDDETMEAMELESPFDILGLYVGVSLDQKSLADTPSDIDRIYLYRRPILDYWCETGEDLYHLVRHVLIHEIGHHFGFSDADMEALENDSG